MSWAIAGPLRERVDGRKVRTPAVVSSQESATVGRRAW